MINQQMPQNMPGMNGLNQMNGPLMQGIPNMPQPMYGTQTGGFAQNIPPAMNTGINPAGAGITGTMPMQNVGQNAQPGIPTPSQPTQRSVSSLSGISRPAAPLESKVEAKSIKIPDFLKNNK